jgi:hypothetical protein
MRKTLCVNRDKWVQRNPVFLLLPQPEFKAP